jgi:hypothetical protein
MDQVQLKYDYAANLLRYNDPFKAAFATTPDAGLALQIGRDWPRDPVVTTEMEKLLAGGDAKNFLPTKEAQAKNIYALAENEKVGVEDRLKAHRLYAEVMGFIEKPNAGNTTNILNQGVMIVKDHGSDEQWQENARAQQRKLTANASVN